MTSLNRLKINPFIIGLSLFVFLLAVSRENEAAYDNKEHPPYLKKVSLSTRLISPEIKTFMESGKAKAVLTVTTDKEGKVPATYYIQQFDFYKTGFSSSDKPDYVLAEVKPVTLKIEGDNQAALPITLNETKTKGSTILPFIKIGFKTMSYAYFTKSSTIDLTIRYTKSGKTNTIIDQQNVFNSKQVTIKEDKWLKIRLNSEEGFYKERTFTVEATVHNYPSEGAIHDFIVPTDLDKQIRSGKLVLKMNNHLPLTTVTKDILFIPFDDTGKYDVKNKGGITTKQDIDGDKLSIQYTYEILYHSYRGYDGKEELPESYYDKTMPETLSKLCPKCVKSDSQGNTSISISELKSYLQTIVKKYYPYPSSRRLAIISEFTREHPDYLADWDSLRVPDFGLRLSVETNDGLQWTARKELLYIYFK